MAVLASEDFQAGVISTHVSPADTIFSNVSSGITYVTDKPSTFRVRSGRYQLNGVNFNPTGFVLMVASVPDGAGPGTLPGDEAMTTWSSDADRVAMLTAMKNNWKVDTFRLQLGQNGVDPNGRNYSQAYVNRIVSVVSELRDYGFVVILCMQDGTPVDGDQHALPTAHTTRAWQKLIPYFNAWDSNKRSGVALEIFNEPEVITGPDTVTPTANDWDQWRNGGSPSGTITQAGNQGDAVVGHQTILEAIRTAGWKEVVIADGTATAHTLKNMPLLTDTLATANVGYAIHTQRYHFSGNTAAQDQSNIWDPMWGTPMAALGIAVTSTEWSIRRVVDQTGVKGVTPDLLDYLKSHNIGIQPWAIDTSADGNFSYVISKTGINAWQPNDWDLWDPTTPVNNTGAGELLYNRYPTWATGSAQTVSTEKVCKIDPTTTGAVRNSGFTPMGKIVTRFAFKFSSLPTADCLIAHLCLGDPTLTGTRIAHLYLTSAGKLVIKDVFTTVATSTMTFAKDTDYALEWMFNGGTQKQTLRMFTSTALTAAPAETLGPVNASAAAQTTVDWVQVGKMTNITWSGGLTIDNYKRANDWVASTASVATIWNEEWVGTNGNDITLPSGWAKEGINTSSPKYNTGGPNIDQSYVNFATQSVGNRNLLSIIIPAGLPSYERWYVQVNAKIQSASEAESIWSAGSLSGVRLFRLVAASGINNTFDLELWADDDWNPTAPDPLPGEPSLPDPLGVISGLDTGFFHRVEVNISATVGPAMCTVQVWEGNRRNETSAPDQTVSGSCVGTSLMRYRRFGQTLHSSVADTIAHRGVAFDGIVMAQNGADIGPLPVAQQFDPPLNKNWKAYEWTGSSERPLTLAGGSLGGATLEPLNWEGDTKPPTGGKLFTGDPGLGKKLYVGADSSSSPRYDVIANLFNFEMRTLSADLVNHPKSNRCAPGCYRGFYGSNGGISAHPTFSKHSALSWDNERKAAANTAISSWSYDANTYTKAAGIFQGDHDTWMKDTLAPFIKDIYERYGHLYCMDLSNEPDAYNNSINTAPVPLWHHNIRRAARYIHFFLKDTCSVPEEAFMVTCGTTMGQTAYQYPARHQIPIRTSELTWLNDSEANRGDAIYYYMPDWKETRTFTNGYWTDAFDPNPVDFIQPGEMDQWNYGRGPIQRMYHTNFYERDYGYANIETYTEFYNKVPSVAGGSPRIGNLFKFLKSLYGGATPVLKVSSANANGIPVFIGEYGCGVWCPLPTDTNAAVPGLTADAYDERFIPDLVANCNVVAYNKWRYDTDTYGNPNGTNADTYSHYWKVGSGATSGTARYDSTNSNTKAEASLFNTNHVADPPPWPNGTVRPPYVSINNGAKRDYRGYNDVPVVP